jgi:hypothetical protein
MTITRIALRSQGPRLQLFPKHILGSKPQPSQNGFLWLTREEIIGSSIAFGARFLACAFVVCVVGSDPGTGFIERHIGGNWFWR